MYTVTEVSEDVNASYLLPDAQTVQVPFDGAVTAPAQNTRLPRTGDSTPIGWLILIMAVSSVLFLLLSRGSLSRERG